VLFTSKENHGAILESVAAAGGGGCGSVGGGCRGRWLEASRALRIAKQEAQDERGLRFVVRDKDVRTKLEEFRSKPPCWS